MAKDNSVSLIEQHVEKLVLGVCAILLLVVLFEWVLSSPERVPVLVNGHTQLVPPDQVDSALGEEARSIKKMFDGATSPVHKLPDYERWIRGVAAQPMPLSLTTLADMGVMGSQITTGTTTAPINPPTVAELSEPRTMVPAPTKPLARAVMQLAESDANRDVQAVYGTCTYPWAELKRNWAEKVSASVFPVAALGVEVEVRQRFPDGPWGEGRPASLARPLDSNKAVAPALPGYNGSNSVEISKVIEKLQAPDCQHTILTPTYPKVYDSTTATFVDSRIYLPRIEGKGDQAPPAEPNARPAANPLPAQGAAAAHAGPAATTAPAVADSWPVSFQDASLKLGAFYQYRVRLVLLNPLYSDEDDAKTPADAAVRDIRSPWSEWSDEQIVNNPTRFFLTGIASPTPNTPGKFRVTVFTRKLGQPVREEFMVEEGSSIGAVKNFKVYSPALKHEVTEPTDFSTGAVCVKTDFEKTVVKARSSPLQTAAMTVLDLKGELKTRLLSEDEKSNAYREMEDEIKRTPKAPAAGAP